MRSQVPPAAAMPSSSRLISASDVAEELAATGEADLVAQPAGRERGRGQRGRRHRRGRVAWSVVGGSVVGASVVGGSVVGGSVVGGGSSSSTTLTTTETSFAFAPGLGYSGSTVMRPSVTSTSTVSVRVGSLAVGDEALHRPLVLDGERLRTGRRRRGRRR